MPPDLAEPVEAPFFLLALASRRRRPFDKLREAAVVATEEGLTPPPPALSARLREWRGRVAQR